MKKCPYCKTLTNDDSVTCPNCLHDISQVNPMPKTFANNENFNITMIVFGLIIVIGGIVAGILKLNDFNNFTNLLKDISLSKEQIANYKELAFNSCVEMIMMFIFSFIGFILTIYGTISIVKKHKKIE